MFNKRNFSEKFGEDVKSLIAMYEASQLSIEGEDDLDDIGHLSSELLHGWLSSHQNHSDALYVTNTLRYPLHYGLSRLMEKSIFLSYLKATNEWTCLEELAKINSSIVRFMNQNEIIEVSKSVSYLKCYFSYLTVMIADVRLYIIDGGKTLKWLRSQNLLIINH